ncbi:MAG: arginine N-succinyltransferase [Motiliproteus sp.]
MQLIRPIRAQDIDALIEIADISGPGFTSLPLHAELLEQKIAQSIESMQQPLSRPQGEHYLFVLEDTESGAVIGTTAIASAVGMNDPWYHYRIGTMVHASRAMNIHNCFRTLYLCNDYTGHSEVCSLFLHPQYRGSKNRGTSSVRQKSQVAQRTTEQPNGYSGTLLSKSRLLFMAQFPDRFAERVIAEMRGVSTEPGISPFWEGLGRHFFTMEFSEADYLTGLGNKSFIAELMPKHSIYIHLLPESAQQVIGEVHSNTRPARKMLEDEGFHFEGYVDIFDAGPTLVSRLKDLRTVRHSQLYPVQIQVKEAGLNVADSTVEQCLLANTGLQQYRCLVDMIHVPDEGHPLLLSQQLAETLLLQSGDSVRMVPLALTRKRPLG